MTRSDGRLVAAGTVLGIGLGGFVDGILLHQILQWHEMVSSVVPPTDLVSVKVNMLYDGVFHAVMWLTTMAGVLLLVSVPRAEEQHMPIGRTFGGALLVGWGMFNVVEGLIDHQLLGLHHVHPGVNELAWDVGFLLGSAALAMIGATLLVRTVRIGTPQLGAA